MAREVKRLWRYRLATTSRVRDLRQGPWDEILGCTVRHYFQQSFVFKCEYLNWPVWVGNGAITPGRTARRLSDAEGTQEGGDICGRPRRVSPRPAERREGDDQRGARQP